MGIINWNACESCGFMVRWWSKAEHDILCKGLLKINTAEADTPDSWLIATKYRRNNNNTRSSRFIYVCAWQWLRCRMQTFNSLNFQRRGEEIHRVSRPVRMSRELLRRQFNSDIFYFIRNTYYFLLIINTVFLNWNVLFRILSFFKIYRNIWSFPCFLFLCTYVLFILINILNDTRNCRTFLIRSTQR